MVSHTVCSIWVWNIIGIICISLHSNSSAQVKGGRIRGEKYPFMPAVLISGDETLSCFLPRPIRCATDLLIPRAMPLRHATCCLEASPSPPLARSFTGNWLGRSRGHLSRASIRPGPPGCQGGYDNLCYRRLGRSQSRAHSIWKSETEGARERGRERQGEREKKREKREILYNRLNPTDLREVTDTSSFFSHPPRPLLSWWYFLGPQDAAWKIISICCNNVTLLFSVCFESHSLMSLCCCFLNTAATLSPTAVIPGTLPCFSPSVWKLKQIIWFCHT